MILLETVQYLLAVVSFAVAVYGGGGFAPAKYK